MKDDTETADGFLDFSGVQKHKKEKPLPVIRVDVDSSALKQHVSGENLVFDKEKEKLRLIENLNHLKSLSVEEFTFFKKWEEVQFYKYLHNRAAKVKSLIWKPTDINDEKQTIAEIEALNPVVKLVGADDPDWLVLRIFCHSAEFNQSPGRYMKFLVTDGDKPYLDDKTKYLGFIAVASDVITINDRDTYVGWSHDNRVKDKKIDNSAIGTCVAPTQPFGFNFLGGKLAAALCVSQTVRDCWEAEYKDKLVGMSVTSLYGPFSQYTRVPWWKDCGKSTGKILMKPDEKYYKLWHEWLKKHRTDEYDKKMTQKEGVSGPVTSAKLRVLSMIFKAAGLKTKQYIHGHERGVFYSLFYENSQLYLQNKLQDPSQLILRDLFKRDTTAIMEWWKPKAIERYKKLKAAGRINPTVLFYDDMIDMPYAEAKEKYFKDVGR